VARWVEDEFGESLDCVGWGGGEASREDGLDGMEEGEEGWGEGVWG
jgi:hypothetical protein